VRCEFPSFVSNFLRTRHPHRDIDPRPSKGFQPTIIQCEELAITFEDANRWDILRTDTSAPEFRRQIINKSPILKRGLDARLTESYVLGVQQLYASPSFRRQLI
jgi:hypothetical protein